MAPNNHQQRMDSQNNNTAGLMPPDIVPMRNFHPRCKRTTLPAYLSGASSQQSLLHAPCTTLDITELTTFYTTLPVPTIHQAHVQMSNTHNSTMLPIPIPIHGSAARLFTLNRMAQRDIQGYIIGQYEGRELSSSRHTRPSSSDTQVVYFLGQSKREVLEAELSDEERRDLEEYIAARDDDVDVARLIRGIEGARVEEYDEDTGSLSTIEEEGEEGEEMVEPLLDLMAEGPADATSDREFKLMVRRKRNDAEPSFAHIMAMAKAENTPPSSSSESDGDSESEDASNHRDNSADVTYKLEDDIDISVDEDSDDDLPLIRTMNQHNSTALFHPRPLQRHNGAVTLATLIARTEAAVTASNSPSPFFSSSVSTSTALPACLDPNFPGHTVCLGRDQQSLGLTVTHAHDVLRERFDFRHEAMRPWVERGCRRRGGGRKRWESGS